MASSRPRKKRSKAAPEPRGLAAPALVAGPVPAAAAELATAIEADGGSVVGRYREPLGGHWQVVAGLPIDRVEPTPYQRDLSATHVARLAEAIERLGRFIDPVVAVRTAEGHYWTPNGNHRLAAMRALGARAILAIVVTDPTIAHRILVLNTEKAHNVRERALEVIRLAEALSELDDRPEKEFETEFEEPALLTLGACYQRNGRFAGGAYHPVLKRTESFSGSRLSKALADRRSRAERLLALDETVSTAVARLKERGFESPYLRAFVVARINPLRFKRGATMDPDEVIDRMTASARKFDPSKIKPGQVAAASGPPDE